MSLEMNDGARVKNCTFSNSDPDPVHFVTTGVHEFARLKTRLTALEDVARAVVAEDHTRGCWRERQKHAVNENYCECNVRRAEEALDE